jgi:hypothetical protein
VRSTLYKSLVLFALFAQAVSLRTLAQGYAKVSQALDSLLVQPRCGSTEAVPPVKEKAESPGLPSLNKLQDFTEDVGGSVVVQ